MRISRCHSGRRGQAVIATWLAGLILLLNMLSASPALHERFHADASQAGHQCAVSLFAHSQVDSACVDLFLPALFAAVAPSPASELIVFHPVIEDLPAGRAPPVVASPC